MRHDRPTYDLRVIQQLVGQGPLSCLITTVARDHATELGLEEVDIVDAVLSLTLECFHKSMEAEKQPGMWQDVYHLEYRGTLLYIKLQLRRDGRAVVVQFKEK